MTADRLALATRTRKARRTSTCPACRAPILTGMTIARLTSPPRGFTCGVYLPSPVRWAQPATKGRDHEHPGRNDQ